MSEHMTQRLLPYTSKTCLLIRSCDCEPCKSASAVAHSTSLIQRSPVISGSPSNKSDWRLRKNEGLSVFNWMCSIDSFCSRTFRAAWRFKTGSHPPILSYGVGGNYIANLFMFIWTWCSSNETTGNLLFFHTIKRKPQCERSSWLLIAGESF